MMATSNKRRLGAIVYLYTSMTTKVKVELCWVCDSNINGGSCRDVSTLSNLGENNKQHFTKNITIHSTNFRASEQKFTSKNSA